MLNIEPFEKRKEREGEEILHLLDDTLAVAALAALEALTASQEAMSRYAIRRMSPPRWCGSIGL
jgi:hypothetical protein